MLDISLQNFEADLITASMQQPVLLDIWAPWCGPCKALGPVLEKVEKAYAGRFTLAKLNSDEQPEIAGQLSQMFGVRSIPFCVLFKGGQPIDGFVGALPEAEIRNFLDKHVAPPEPVDDTPAEPDAQALLAGGDIDAALEKLQEAVVVNPADQAARYAYLHALLSAGRIADAQRVYEPVATDVLPDPRLSACGLWLAAAQAAATGRSPQELEAALAANKRDFDARFELAQHHFAAQRYTQAMDELLEILMRDKAWHDGLARKVYVAILEVMTGPVRPAGTDAAPAAASTIVASTVSNRVKSPQDDYRRRLSMVIF